MTISPLWVIGPRNGVGEGVGELARSQVGEDQRGGA